MCGGIGRFRPRQTSQGLNREIQAESKPTSPTAGAYVMPDSKYSNKDKQYFIRVFFNFVIPKHYFFGGVGLGAGGGFIGLVLVD